MADPLAVLRLLLIVLAAAAAAAAVVVVVVVDVVFLWTGRGGVIISTCSIDSDIASLVRGEFSKAAGMERVRLSLVNGGVVSERGGEGGVCALLGGRATTSTPS